MARDIQNESRLTPLIINNSGSLYTGETPFLNGTGREKNFSPVYPDITPFYPPNSAGKKQSVAHGVRTARAGYASLQLAPSGDRLLYDFIPEIAEVAFADKLQGISERLAREITLHSFFGFTYQRLVKIAALINGADSSRITPPVEEMLEWMQHHPFKSELSQDDLARLITRRPDSSDIYQRLGLIEPVRRNRVWVEPDSRIRTPKPVREKPPVFPRGSDLTEPQIRALKAHFVGSPDGLDYAFGPYYGLTRLVYADEIAAAATPEEALAIVHRKVGSAFTYAKKVTEKLDSPHIVNGKLPPNISQALAELGVSREIALQVVRREISYPELQQIISEIKQT